MKWCNSTLAGAVYLFVSVITITAISAAAAPPPILKERDCA
jgi:hypothetical protein